VIEFKKKVGVLFVCMGNICRSPTAEGVFRKIVSDASLSEYIHIDSAGTHSYHVNQPPDRRARNAAERRGFVLDDICSRRIKIEDFEQFDYILAMDMDNLLTLQERAPEHHQCGTVSLFLEFAKSVRELEVPDPYYGGPAGFEHVLDLVDEASRGLLETLKYKNSLD
jgi:protein-tyrosine phosphatase